MGDVEAGFAKLQGEDFEYYMQTYSIVLGRNSKKSSVDIDLSYLGGGMNISRQHARIYYDFDRKRFALEVTGKNGCLVEGVLYLPGNPPIKLDSQDLLQIGDKKFYFLLPVRKIVKPQHQHLNLNANANNAPLALPTSAVAVPGGASGTLKKRGGRKEDDHYQQQEPQHPPTKKWRSQGKQDGGLDNASRERKQSASSSWSPHEMHNPYIMPKQGFPYHSDQKGDLRRRADHEAEMFQQMQEEKDVVSAVATVLSDLCGPGEWMAMAKLHSENEVLQRSALARAFQPFHRVAFPFKRFLCRPLPSHSKWERRPSSGSALFTFSSSLNCPRITAHISVVFYEEAQEGESSSHQEGPGSVTVPSLNLQMGIGSASMQILDAQARSAQAGVMAPADPGPFNSTAALVGDMPDTGWCRIVEEPPDD